MLITIQIFWDMTLVTFYQPIWHHIEEDLNLQQLHFFNHQSSTVVTLTCKTLSWEFGKSNSGAMINIYN